MRLFNSLLPQVLDPDLPSPNSMRFVPVELSLTYRTIGEADFPESFSFSPAACAVAFSQPVDFADRVSRRNGFDVRNRAEKFKPHACATNGARQSPALRFTQLISATTV